MVPERIADLGIGAGVFGQRAELVWKGARRLGCEVRRAEAYAARHYDAGVVWGDYFEPATVAALRRYRPDLIVSNPPYASARRTLQLALDILPPGGWLLLLLRATFGGSELDDQQLRRTPPVAEYSIPGRLKLRRGQGRTGRDLGGDFVGHVFLAFQVGRVGPPCWERRLLPPLPSSWLGWTVRPGDEATVDPLPQEFWPRKEMGRG